MRESYAHILKKAALRINEQIDAKAVRLIDEKGTQLGVKSISDALAIASEKQLDLVEVAPKGSPVVCKLLNYGRFAYQEKKKRNVNKTRQRNSTIKMVKFRPNTFKGDRQIKMQKIRRFLEEGDKVKAVMQFRGREIIHTQHGFEVFKQIAAELSDCGVVDLSPTAEGKFINMMLAPLPGRVRGQKKSELNGNGKENTPEV